MYFNFANTAREHYDEVTRRLNNGQPITKLSDWPVGGCLERAARQEDSAGSGVFSESVDAFQSVTPGLT